MLASERKEELRTIQSARDWFLHAATQKEWCDVVSLIARVVSCATDTEIGTLLRLRNEKFEDVEKIIRDIEARVKTHCPHCGKRWEDD